MESEASLVERLRDRIVGGLHRGTLHSGDRLEGVREIARRTGMDPRAVAKAYQTLEAEGLVEVRGRSGVYVTRHDGRNGEMLPETARWMTEVLVEAWRRMIKLPDFPGFIRRYTASVPIRCALVESVEDLVAAYAYELRNDWGLEVEHVFFDARGVRREEGVLDFGSDLGRLMDGFQDADLIVTTNFYARPVRAAAEALEKPVVILTTHPEFDATRARGSTRGFPRSARRGRGASRTGQVIRGVAGSGWACRIPGCRDPMADCSWHQSRPHPGSFLVRARASRSARGHTGRGSTPG